jgi:predicted CopG family antitoxin
MLKTIKISEDAHAALLAEGRMGETFDEVILRILNKKEVEE